MGVTRAVLSFAGEPPPVPECCQEHCSLLRSVLADGHHHHVPSARARVRAELTAEITDAARRQLAEVGAATLPMSPIAGLVGYTRQSSFNRWFAEAFGASPSSWRKTAAQTTSPEN